MIESVGHVITKIIGRHDGQEGQRLCEFIDDTDDVYKVLQVIRGFIDKSMNLKMYKDANGRTALHCAVEKGFVPVCALLVSEGDLDALEESSSGDFPIKMAIKDGKRQDDKLTELLVKNTKKTRVKALMLRTGNKRPVIDLQEILKKEMPKTTIALLDCLAEDYKVYGQKKMTYAVLEADSTGITPGEDTDGVFDYKDQSALHIMVSRKQKDFLHHEVVRSLVKSKWNKYGRKQYLWTFIWYLISLACLTFSMWSAVFTADVHEYNSPLDYARAVIEIIAYLCVCASVIEELGQCCMCLRRLESSEATDDSCIKRAFGSVTRYLIHDKYNTFEMMSAVLLMCVLPVRYIDVENHWYLFSVGYLFWVLRIFKFAALSRRMATYIGLLYQLMIDVFPPFAALFLVQTLGFGGALLLALKGDNALDVNLETSSFQMILLTGVRTLAEGGPIVEGYIGDNGHRFMSSLIMLVFIFMIVVVLFNILIAQLTDQLPKSRLVVDKNLTFTMAEIISNIESNSCHLINVFKITNCRKVIKQSTTAKGEHYKPEGVDEVSSMRPLELTVQGEMIA